MRPNPADRHESCIVPLRRGGPPVVGERANADHAILGGRILAHRFCAFNFLFSVIDPDHGNSLRGVVFFGTPLFPAMMGLVLLVAGYTTALLSRANWDTPQAA